MQITTRPAVGEVALRWRWLALVACCAIAAWLLRPSSEPAPLGIQYPGPWSDAFALPISQALARHGAANCGEIWHRAAAATPAEYLVYCSSGGRQWSAYLVWTSSGDVMGPLKPSADVPPPH